MTIPPKPACLSNQAYENIVRCRGTSLAQKGNYLTDLALCGSDLNCASSKHGVQIRGQNRRGKTVADLLPDEGLGVLIEENAFIKYLCSRFGKSPRKFRNQVNSMI